jgi:DNA-binding transcriptional regulator YdaS (Cro superfamily)
MEESIASARVKAGIKAAGGVATVAQAFEINRASVYEWIRNGLVPSERCPRIVKMAQGAATVEQLNDKFDWEEAREILAQGAQDPASDAQLGG